MAGEIQLVPEEEMSKTEKVYEQSKVTYKKIKKATFDVIDNFLEFVDMKKNEFMVIK
jgi:hypothetical protein